MFNICHFGFVIVSCSVGNEGLDSVQPCLGLDLIATSQGAGLVSVLIQFGLGRELVSV